MKTRTAVVFFSVLAMVTSAETRQHARARNQQARIGAGVRDGSLTPAETIRLERKEADLARDARRMRLTGGGLTPVERARIEARQDGLSRQIYRERHDGQGR